MKGKAMRVWQAVALAMLAVSSGALAGAGRTSYTIGVEDIEYYPLHSTRHAPGKPSEYVGFAREVLDAFARAEGYNFEYRPMPINRLFDTYFGGDTLDFKYPDNPLWQAARRKGATLSYSVPIVLSQEGALVAPARRGHPLAQIKVLGTVAGFTPWPYLPTIEAKAMTLTTSASFDSLLRHAIAADIDAVYMNVDVANYQLGELLKQQGQLVFDPGLPHASSAFSLSSRRHHEVVAKFDRFLRQHGALLQQLRAKYKIAEPESH
ncbi:MAG: hypothetical protein V4582_15355 [Pseudomonadota bacterium]